MINIDLDKYLRNFRIFYSKVVGGHPQQSNLEKKFKFLLENQASKWRNDLFLISAEDTVNSARSFMSKARSVQFKPSAKKQNQQWMFETINFSRCFVFICILSLLQVKSSQGIRMIRAHLENQGALTDGKLFQGIVHRKISYEWIKIQKLFLNAFNSKPHLSLGESINELPEEFIDLVYQVFTDKKVPKINVGQTIQKKLNILCNLILINITYFEFENERTSSVKKYGDYNKNVNVGYLPNQKIYVVAKQLPKRHKQDVNERKTLDKLSKISNELFTMYENDQVKLRNLDSVALTKSTHKGLTGLPTSARMDSLVRKSSLSASKGVFW